jgi:hypothetical protein
MISTTTARFAPHKAPVRKMRQKPDRAKKMFVATCSMMNVTGHSPPPTAGTTLIGSAAATMTRITASARMAVPQMTVHTRQIHRNRGSRCHSSSHDWSTGRTH